MSAPTEIRDLLKDFEEASSAIEKQIEDITYFSRGVGLNEAYGMSHIQRQRHIKNISKRLKEASGDTREWL